VNPVAATDLDSGGRWPRRHLKDVAALLPAHSVAAAGDMNVVVITTARLAESLFRPSGAKKARMRAEDVAGAAVSLGEVLVARSNTADLVGRAAMYMGEPPGAVASDLTIRIRSGEKLYPEFLSRYLSALFVTGYWQDRAGGTSGSMKKITRAQISLLEIPVPALEVQRSLVEGVNQLMTEVERARTAAEAQVESVGLLRSAVLRSAFSEGSSKSWPVVNLESVSEIVSGVTLGRRPPVGSTRAVQYLTVANVKDGYLNLEDVRSIEITDSELEKWRLESGDLLLTEGGDPDKLGRGTIWREELPNCIHQNHIFRVRFRTSEVLPEFAAAQASSPYGKAYFFAHAKQTTGIATINQRVLRAFPFLRPPMPEQERIVADLRARSEEIERLRRHADTELQAVKALPAALLRQAFTGEL